MVDGEPTASFGTLLRQHRLRAGLTQEALAERAGVSLRALQYLERSAGRPQRDTTRRLADALALTPEHRALFEHAGAPAPRKRAASGRPAVDQMDPPDDLSGAYKQVTILVADVVGLTDSAQSFEPDLADRLLGEIVPRLAEVVHQHGGTVNRGGDGVMALFGAPVAREDDAVRACYAALALHAAFRPEADRVARERGVSLALRIGLDSGEVAIRTAGNDLYREYSALGPAVRVAARLGQLADDGATLLAPETARLAEGHVGLRPAGPVPAGRAAEPVEAFKLEGTGPAGTRFQRIVATRPLTRFVGRDAELQALVGALERAGAGRGQVVALVGEPGVGKSRLVWELTHAPDTAGWLILEGGSTAAVYSDAGRGRATPYLPVVELLKGYFRIEARDDARTIRRKVGDRILALDVGLGSMLPPVLALLDVPPEDAAWDLLDAAQRRRQTLDALKRLLLRESQRQPLLLVFEDLHWIDAETQALLDSLADGLPAARILLLVNYRPEYTHAWGSRTYYAQLRIDPLSERGTDDLLTGLLGDDATLDPLKRLLAERTEGNPLFLEESVRSLVETGQLVGQRSAYRLDQPVHDLRIPATVQAVLAARIDRLPPEQKRLLQTAAVIGKDVPVALLQAIAERPEDEVQSGLSALQAAELLYEAGLFPGPEYTFKHALTHEVAYRGLLHDRRRELHARIVRAIERLYPDRLAEHVERLAHHATRGELWEQAAEYSYQVGLRATERSANRDAVAYFDSVIATLDRLPGTRRQIELGIDARRALHTALFPLAEIDRLPGLHQAALALAESIDDQGHLCYVLVGQANLLWRIGQYEPAIAAARRSYAIALKLGDADRQASALHQLGNARHAMGDWRASSEIHAQVVTLIDGLPEQRWWRTHLLLSVGWVAHGLSELGDLTEAVQWAERGVEQAERRGYAFALVGQCASAGHVYLLKGELDLSIELLERARDVGQEHGYLASNLRLLADLAAAYALQGSLDRALALVDEVRTIDASSPIVSWRSGARTQIGEVYLRAGQCEEAERLVRSAVAQATERGERGYLAYAQRMLGEILAHRDSADHASAEVCFRDALALAEDLGLRPLQAHCHLGLGRLYRHRPPGRCPRGAVCRRHDAARDGDGVLAPGGRG